MLSTAASRASVKAAAYAALSSFVEEKFDILQAAFPSKMKRALARPRLWRVIGKVNQAGVEAAFRKHAADLCRALGPEPGDLIAYDGKIMTWSFYTFSYSTIGASLDN